MNTRLMIKFVFVIAVLLFMVLMGMSNDQPASFRLNLLKVNVTQVPSALMYFVFFAVGLMTGGVLALGAGKSSSRSSKKD